MSALIICWTEQIIQKSICNKFLTKAAGGLKFPAAFVCLAMEYAFICENYTANCGICQYNKLQYCIIAFGDNMYSRIRDLRTDRDLTQKQVAEILNCSQQVYSNYELGQRDVPTEILIALAKYYNVSVDYILGLTDKTNK